MRTFEYLRPESLHGALEELGRFGPDARPLAGGTDLMVGMRHGIIQPRAVVDLKRVSEMAPAIEQHSDTLTIGANTPLRDIEENQVVTGALTALVESSRVVGSVQIRNRATLAGNLCNASPAADTTPALFALDATVEIGGLGGDRSLPVDQFLTGYRETALAHRELVIGVRIPVPEAPMGSAFLKLGVRRAMEISVVCVAAALTLGGAGEITSARIGLGSVAPRTMRALAAEQLLIGEEPRPELFARAGEASLEVCDPITDLRGSAEYRRAMVPVQVRRALSRAAERVGVRS